MSPAATVALAHPGAGAELSADGGPPAPAPAGELGAFRAHVRAVVGARIAPHVDAWEAARGMPRTAFRALGAEGLLGVAVPARHAGLGAGFWHGVALVEELALSRSPGVAASILSHAMVCAPLVAAYGDERQKHELLPPMVAGELVAGIAATEPGAGSDLAGIACQARDDGDAWELSGEKKFITNAPIADLLLVLARRNGATGLRGFVLLLVPTATPGCVVHAPLRTLGLRSSPLGWLRFERCRIAKRLTLGDPHGGFLYAARQLMVERLLASVGALALARLVLDETVSHVRGRRAYGRTLGALQVIRHTLVDQATDVAALRRFGHALCASAAVGRLEEAEICMLKVRAAELLQRLVGVCLQLHGAAGFLEDHWLARIYRDVRALGLAGGSNGMLKDLIAGYLRI